MSNSAQWSAIILMILLIFYSTVGTLMAQLNISVGSKESATIILGMLFSLLQHNLKNTDIMDNLKFNEETFFYIFLPPILFARGFNLNRVDYIDNIKIIMILGIITTFVCFFSFSVLTIWVSHMDILQQYDNRKK